METALAWIGKLYAVEKDLRERCQDEWKTLSLEERAARIAAERQERSRPLLGRLPCLAGSGIAEGLAQERGSRGDGLHALELGGAVGVPERRLVGHRQQRRRELGAGPLPGTQNWLFCGSDRGGRAAAIHFSLLASCKRHGHDPWVYYRDVLTPPAGHASRAPARKTLLALLPHRWQPGLILPAFPLPRPPPPLCYVFRRTLTVDLLVGPAGLVELGQHVHAAGIGFGLGHRWFPDCSVSRRQHCPLCCGRGPGEHLPVSLSPVRGIRKWAMKSDVSPPGQPIRRQVLIPQAGQQCVRQSGNLSGLAAAVGRCRIIIANGVGASHDGSLDCAGGVGNNRSRKYSLSLSPLGRTPVTWITGIQSANAHPIMSIALPSRLASLSATTSTRKGIGTLLATRVSLPSSRPVVIEFQATTATGVERDEFYPWCLPRAVLIFAMLLPIGEVRADEQVPALCRLGLNVDG